MTDPELKWISQLPWVNIDLCRYLRLNMDTPLKILISKYFHTRSTAIFIYWSDTEGYILEVAENTRHKFTYYKSLSEVYIAVILLGFPSVMADIEERKNNILKTLSNHVNKVVVI
jgi:hypothetical protein